MCLRFLQIKIVYRTLRRCFALEGWGGKVNIVISCERVREVRGVRGLKGWQEFR